MSLIEPKKVSKVRDGNDSLYVDAHFKDTPFIWTADEYARTDKGDASNVWVVSFDGGYCGSYHVNFNLYVRAVR